MMSLLVIVVFLCHASRFCSVTHTMKTSKLNWNFLDAFVCCQDLCTSLSLAQSCTHAPMTTPDTMSCSLYLHCFQPVSATSPRSPATIRCLLILSALRPSSPSSCPCRSHQQCLLSAPAFFVTLQPNCL